MEIKAISELKDYTFVIPYQQRGYRWTKDNINILLEDFSKFIEDKTQKMYCLQPIAVVPQDTDKEDTQRFIVIDGQQRLTTLYILWKYLQLGSSYQFEFERDNNNDRKNFLEKISDIQDVVDCKIDFFYISQAFLTIKKWFDKNGCESEFRILLTAPKSEKSVQVLWYEVEEKKEHEAFRDINSGKIQLSNCDLIKALLLNDTNGLENRQQIAAQYEMMERQFSDDQFWYMMQRKDVEPQKGQSRMDLLFNMVAEVTSDEYQIDSRKSFFKFSTYSKCDLAEMWKKAREKYQRLRDIFNDPYTFHYVGFLVFYNEKLDIILNDYEMFSKSQYKTVLKKKIKDKLRHTLLEDYSYFDDKKDLQKLFVLHNIETLLCRYEELKNNHNLNFTYESFPFKLLYNHRWNIEHIASHTDNDLKTENDRKDWIDSVFSDFANLSDNNYQLKEKAEKDLNNDENFNKLYKSVVEEVEKVNGNNSIAKEDDKNGIGNLVLLDEHTNKSFHNSLFPRKRRIVIIASGLRSDNDCEENVNSVYVPICTQQVYTKSYNKQSNVNLNFWGQDDYDAYLSDMQEKLKFYFDTNKGE